MAERVVRQWLETDAAFGVSEVPLKGGAGALAALPAAPVAPIAPPKPRPLAAPAARPAVVPPPRPTGLIPGMEEPAGRGAGMARKKAVMGLPPAPAGNVPDLSPTTRKQKEASLEGLRAQIERDSKPHINNICTRVVFGEGDPDADLMFVGEGPGVEEDRTGRPFVGRSGQLLDKMIAAIGLKREQVYIGNVVKLRCADWDPTGSKLTDRPPNPEEVARGLPLLHQQIEIIRPKVIVTLGAPAVKYLTGTTEGVMKIRGTWLSYRGIPVMPTYHPSFVLRAYTEENRRKVWNDLKAAIEKIKELS
jgi:DNA polymerase